MSVKVSVRSLVEFILRHGDIDNRKSGSPDEMMLAGAQMHRKIQSRMGSEYTAEQPLKYEFNTEMTTVVVDGRADGIITYPNQVIIDEIKSTYRDLDRIDEPELLHLAQAKCYAAIFAMQQKLDVISVRITYANLDTEELRYFQSEHSVNEITEWFKDLCSEYAKWVDMRERWIILRQESIQNLEFPYAYRPGQKELVSHVYRSIYHGKKLFIEAPTGTGKTLSVLFPAIRSMGEGRGNVIFYLTARTIARTVAEEAFEILKEHGLKARNLTLTAKDKICFMDEVNCNPESCKYAKGHFDRINECLYEIVTSTTSFGRETIEEYARKYEVCPFELALDVSLFADCVIGDYNYVFDPNAFLRRFFEDGIKGDYLFLIDEAHNLVDRGREMYSATLIKEDLLKTKRACKDRLYKICASIDKCNTDMLALKRLGNGGLTVERPENISSLVTHVERLYSNISEYLAENTDGQGHEEVLDLFFVLRDFLAVYDMMQNNYIVYTDYDSNGDFFVKLFNVDPALNLAACMNKARASVLFSATLLPIQYYKSLLGGYPSDYEVYAQSVFDQKKRLLIGATDVDSKYSGRTAKQYSTMARYIHCITSARKGNYMIFAPSYSYMYEVYETYLDEFYDSENEEIICQLGQMKESDREEFLKRFKGIDEDVTLNSVIDAEIEIEDKSLIGFCVLGGIFSEGIDLKSDALIGVIIIGTGLPQIGGERDLLKDYFDSEGVNGFDYAYRFPGMNRVQQAAGRLIRTLDDEGVIALLDERYSYMENRRLFPREWNDIKYTNIDQISEMVNDFWKRVEDNG